MNDLFAHSLILCTNTAVELRSEETHRQSVMLACLLKISLQRFYFQLSSGNAVEFNFLKFHNSYSRRRADRYGSSRCAKISRAKVDGIPFLGSYLNVLLGALPAYTRIIIHTIQRIVAAACTSVSAPGCLSFVCFRASPRETEKKRRAREKTGETEGKEILFVPEATPISIVAPHREPRAAAAPREYINFCV